MTEVIEKRLIESMIRDRESDLNQKDEDGAYTYSSYMNEVGSDNPLAAIENCNYDNIDFNLGHEQGYLDGMKAVLAKCETPKLSECEQQLRDNAARFEADMITRRDKTEMEYYMECIASDSDKEIIDQDYTRYKSDNEGDEDMLNKSEWLDEVYFVENGDEITDLINEYHEPLSIEVYKNHETDEKIISVCLGLGGPNIYIKLDTKYEKAEWTGGWGMDTHKVNLSYLFDTINSIYNIDTY